MSWITKFLTTILCFQAVFSSGRTTLDRFLEDDSFFLRVSRLGAGASDYGEYAFDKAFEGSYYCSDTPLASSGSKGFLECKTRCMENELCQYMIFWQRTKNKLCQLFEVCTPVKAEGVVSVYKKVTPCDVAHEQYYKLMALNFPEGIMRHEPPRRNFFCHCMLPFWMFCAIMAPPGSVEEIILSRKLESKDAAVMYPFYRKEGMTIYHVEAQITNIGVTPTVFAELQIWRNLKRCMRVDRCTQGTPENRCPVLKSVFKAGDVVYILQTDLPLVHLDFPVMCVSVRGLCKLSTNPAAADNRGFKDPLGRFPERFLTENDYTAFWLLNDEDFEGTICDPPEPISFTLPESAQPAPPKLSKGQKKKLKMKTSPPSPEPNSSSEAQADSNAASSSSQGRSLHEFFPASSTVSEVDYDKGAASSSKDSLPVMVPDASMKNPLSSQAQGPATISSSDVTSPKTSMEKHAPQSKSPAAASSSSGLSDSGSPPKPGINIRTKPGTRAGATTQFFVPPDVQDFDQRVAKVREMFDLLSAHHENLSDSSFTDEEKDESEIHAKFTSSKFAFFHYFTIFTFLFIIFMLHLKLKMSDSQDIYIEFPS